MSTHQSNLLHQRCPCGSLHTYQRCCYPYIAGVTAPATAQQLMRSRYTAYTQANIEYIQATMRGPAAQHYDPTTALQWAKTVKWRKLKILKDFPHVSDKNCAYVEFVAFYFAEGRLQQLRETSEFKRIEGKWFYTNQASPKD